MRSKTHTALTAPLVLHRTRLDKCAMKNSVSMANCGINFFWLPSIVFHLENPLWMLCAFKMRNGVSKTPSITSFFPLPKCEMNILRSCLNCSTIENWKTRKRSNTFKGSQRRRGGGGGWIFLKTYRTSPFNEDLSNEPNFGRIHLCGQYL
jgi:hypothetical protein